MDFTCTIYVNNTFDFEKVLFINNNYYEIKEAEEVDDIYPKIIFFLDGFFAGLDFANLTYSKEVIYLSPKDEMFNICGFTNNEEREFKGK